MTHTCTSVSQQSAHIARRCPYLLGMRASCAYLEHPVEVLDLQMGGQLELVADVVATLPRVWDVNGEDEGLVTERLHPVHDLLRQLPVPIDVQLEPAVAVGCGGHDFLHRAGGVGAGDVTGVESLSGCQVRSRRWVFKKEIKWQLI